MTSWNQVLGLDEPVQGNLGDFEAASSELEFAASHAREVAVEFGRIERGAGSDVFAGAAAEAFRGLIGDVTQAVACLPTVLGQVGDTLGDHAAELRTLRQRSREALARAQTSWNASRDGADDLGRLAQQRRRLRAQLQELEAINDGNPDTEHRILVAQDELLDVDRDVTDTQARIDRAEASLDDSRNEWRHLRGAEDDLEKRTRARLEQQELWSLGDPSNIEKLVSIGAVVVENMMRTINPVTGVMGLLSDEWLWAIWDAFEQLEVLLAGLSLVALLVPGGLPFVAGALLVLAAIKLSVGLTLYLRGSTDPATGRGISGSELLLDAALLGLSGAGAVLKPLKVASRVVRFAIQVPPVVKDSLDLGVGTYWMLRDTADDFVNTVESLSGQANRCRASGWPGGGAGVMSYLAPVAA